jgi:hypothetical protein
MIELQNEESDRERQSESEREREKERYTQCYCGFHCSFFSMGTTFREKILI